MTGNESNAGDCPDEIEDILHDILSSLDGQSMGEEDRVTNDELPDECRLHTAENNEDRCVGNHGIEQDASANGS